MTRPRKPGLYTLGASTALTSGDRFDLVSAVAGH
jgi:hypothetical protein